MNIYIDESGSFVNAPMKGSWNVVAAVATPESSRKAIAQAIAALKLTSSTPLTEEVKLNALDEKQYLQFLDKLSRTHALLFATATDAGVNSPDQLSRHKQLQVAMVRANIPRMRFEGGKIGVTLLADQLEMISPQLYAQLICQVDLLHNVVSRSINYFAQRIPGTLSEFLWRIDQKNTSKTTYESAFEKIAPALLQSKSFREPLIRVEGFNYRHFSQYEFPDGKVPDSLEEETGVRVEHALNIQKIIRGNIKFEDSKHSVGIQVADLLASGLRRCMRGGFEANDAVACALGSLTLQNQRGKFPLHLIIFSDEEGEADETASRVIKVMKKHSRTMFTKNAP